MRAELSREVSCATVEISSELRNLLTATAGTRRTAILKQPEQGTGTIVTIARTKSVHNVREHVRFSHRTRQDLCHHRAITAKVVPAKDRRLGLAAVVRRQGRGSGGSYGRDEKQFGERRFAADAIGQPCGIRRVAVVGDYNECYILPSAHFPILLTFNVSERRCSDSIVGEERLYRTKAELVSLKSSSPCEHHSFSVQGAVAGTISESGESLSVSRSATNHTWRSGGFLVFETRSSWGAPQTLSLRLSGQSDNFDKRGNFNSEVGFCWLDLSEQWKHGEVSEYSSTKKIITDVWPINAAACQFDDHGDLPEEAVGKIGRMQLEVRVTTESVEFVDVSNGDQSRKRMLLYKHDDDLRQEAFAIQFIKTCSDILKVSGLDMKLLTFQCIPVGARRGFVEWVPGSVPLSEICHPFSSILPSKSPADGRESPPTLSKAGLSKYESLRRLGGQQNESLRRLATGTKAGARGSIANDPIQDYLRSVAFDAGAPYLIRRDVMETYVKSCAGYSVITYILGVGDRHLDNLLLHQSGSFFHCDFSFILGSDPKTFLPMRITEDMVYGMGGNESDNYARFLSLIGAAFLALRRPENVRVLLSMVRLMQASCLPDISENQTVEQAILGVRDRLRLDLSDSRAITYMEDLVEASLSNKMWIAVDAMHHLGKTF